nr:hypothetical protein [Tanacetum cinerariifolium]
MKKEPTLNSVVVYSTAKADLGISTPNEFIPEQHGINERTQNYSLDHIFAGTNLSVLVDKTKSAGDGLKITHTDLAEFLGLPSQISSVQEKLKTFDALPSLVHKVTDTLSRFATIMENPSSKATDKGVPLASYRKSKEVMSSKDAKDEETESDSKDDHANPAETMTESNNQKKLKFSFATKGGKQIHLTTEKIEEQNRIEESLKA